MKLTRKILTEKTSQFHRYNHPEEISDLYWEKAFKDLQRQGLGIKNGVSKYLACEIFLPLLNFPLLNMKTYQISHKKQILHKSFRSITLINHNAKLYYSFDLFYGSWYNIYNYIKLKWFICKIWEEYIEPVQENQFIENIECN